jgi:hypothetical protein
MILSVKQDLLKWRNFLQNSETEFWSKKLMWLSPLYSDKAGEADDVFGYVISCIYGATRRRSFRRRVSCTSTLESNSSIGDSCLIARKRLSRNILSKSLHLSSIFTDILKASNCCLSISVDIKLCLCLTFNSCWLRHFTPPSFHINLLTYIFSSDNRIVHISFIWNSEWIFSCIYCLWNISSCRFKLLVVFQKIYDMVIWSILYHRRLNSWYFIISVFFSHIVTA